MLYNCLNLTVNGTSTSIRALDKREYLMIIFLFLMETICCDPSSEPSRLVETVQTRGYNI